MQKERNFITTVYIKLKLFFTITIINKLTHKISYASGQNVNCNNFLSLVHTLLANVISKPEKVIEKTWRKFDSREKISKQCLTLSKVFPLWRLLWLAVRYCISQYFRGQIFSRSEGYLTFSRVIKFAVLDFCYIK